MTGDMFKAGKAGEGYAALCGDSSCQQQSHCR